MTPVQSYEKISFSLNRLQRLFNPIEQFLFAILGVFSITAAIIGAVLAPGGQRVLLCLAAIASLLIFRRSLLRSLHALLFDRYINRIELSGDFVNFGVGNCDSKISRRLFKVSKGLFDAYVLRSPTGDVLVIPKESIPLQKLKHTVEVGDMLDSVEAKYEYRLSFLQILFNPPIVLVLRVLTFIAYTFFAYKATLEVSNWSLWILSIGLALLSFMTLFYVWRPWRACLRLLIFTKKDVGYGIAGIDQVYPYNLLKVGTGLMGTWLIRSVTGHYIILPQKIIERQALERLIAEHRTR